MQRLLNKRLAKSLLIEIIHGEYQDGGPFLSNRKIQKLWNVSQTTTDKSLRFLKEQEVIAARNRATYYIPAGGRERAMFLNHYCDDKPLLKSFQRAKKSSKSQRSQRYRFALILETARFWAKWRADLDEHSMSALPMPKLSSASPDLRSGFLSEARLNKCQVDIIMLNKGENSQRFLQSCLQKVHWHGAAHFRRSSDLRYCENIEVLKKAKIPQITIMEPIGDRSIPCVDVNNFALGYEAAMVLIQSGAKRFIFLDVLEETNARNARTRGALHALKMMKIEAQPIIYRMSHLTEDAIPDGFAKLLAESTHTPTGLFALYNQLVEKVAPLIDMLELQIPNQLSLVNCSTPVVLVGREKPLPFVEVNFREIGKTAFHALNSLLEGEMLKKYTIIEPTLREGKEGI